MRRVWLIRAGEDAEQIDAMRHAGLIGVRYEAVGDVRQLTSAEIEQALIDAGQGAGVAARRSALLSFANDVRPGDLIVSPNERRHEVWVGMVAGEYQYNQQPAVAGYEHTRQVDWLGWLDRDAAWMRDQLKSLERPETVFELPSREWWWRQVDTREFTPQLRTTWATSRSTTPRAKASRSATADTSSAAPKRTRAKAAATPVRKPPVALVRCAGTCGFQWAPTSLVDGLCADCRADL
jgi:predicted Mrr-cat superfamily restriction endonuclease